MLSNRFAFVNREPVRNGTTSGIDFGRNVVCLARSPKAALFWNGGGGYWSGRGMPQAYAASHLTAFYRSVQGQRLDYTRIGAEGGRLTPQRIAENKIEIAKLFGDDGDVIDPIIRAVRDRKTLLIEGGGEIFMPRWEVEQRV